MGLINRLIGTEDPKVSVHAFPKAYDMYERDRILLDTLIQSYELELMREAIAAVFPGTNKLGLSVGHLWQNGDAAQLHTDGTPPTGLDINTIYFIADSNPTEGSVKLSRQPDGTPIAEFIDEGTGSHSLGLVDADVIFWGQTRRSISSNAGAKDEELRKRVWDEMAEGIFELAESSVAFVDEQIAKDELVYSASYLDAS